MANSTKRFLTHKNIIDDFILTPCFFSTELNWDKIIQEAETYAKNYCEKDPEDPLQWEIHIPLTRKYSKLIAEIENADTRIVDLAAILHDTGKYMGRENHHIRSHELAKTFLAEQDLFDSDRELVLKCILKHRTRYTGESDPIEVKIIRSADILAVLFDDIWQSKSRKNMSREALISIYDKAYQDIELETAKKIAKPQLALLKEQLMHQ